MALINTNTGPEGVEVINNPLGVILPPGAATAITAFIVYSSYSGAPQDAATSVVSIDEFEGYFGTSSYFSPADGYYAVRGFFENAGSGAHAIIINVAPTAVGSLSYDVADDTHREIDGKVGELDDNGLISDFAIKISDYNITTGVLTITDAADGGTDDYSMVRAGDYFQDRLGKLHLISAVSDSADTITIPSGLTVNAYTDIKFTAVAVLAATVTVNGVAWTAAAAADHANREFARGADADASAAGILAMINDSTFPEYGSYYAYHHLEVGADPVIRIRITSGACLQTTVSSDGSMVVSGATAVLGTTHLYNGLDLVTGAGANAEGKIRRLPAADAYNGYGILQPTTSIGAVTPTAYSVSSTVGTVTVGGGGLFSLGLAAGDYFIDSAGMGWLVTSVPEDDYFVVYSGTNNDTASGVSTAGAGAAYSDSPAVISDTASTDGANYLVNAVAATATFTAAAAGYATEADGVAARGDYSLSNFYVNMGAPLNITKAISYNTYVAGTSRGAAVGAVTVTTTSPLFDVVTFATGPNAATVVGDVWVDFAGTVHLIEDLIYDAAAGDIIEGFIIKNNSSASTGGPGTTNQANHRIYWEDTSLDVTAGLGVASNYKENDTLIDVSDSVSLTDNDYMIVSVDAQDADFIGTAANEKGLNALNVVDDVNLICIPGGHSPTIQNAIIDYTETTRSDCFSLLSIPDAYTNPVTSQTIVSVTVTAVASGVASLDGSPNLGAVLVGDVLYLDSVYYRILAIDDDTYKLDLDSSSTVSGGSGVIYRPSAIIWKDSIINNPSTKSAWYINHLTVSEYSDSSSVNVDPVGHVAGVMNRIDNNVKIGGISHAPSGMRHSSLAGTTGLAMSISERLHGEGLREAFINRITSRSGSGRYIYGGYTAGGSSVTSEEQLVQVMRSSLYIKNSLEANLASWIWENYSLANADRVKQSILAFCRANSHLFPEGLSENDQFRCQVIDPTAAEESLGLLRVKLQVRFNTATKFIEVALEFPIPSA